ncbi:Imm7 family immunity protein [Streptomyces sp. NPDC102467]|uniref:Imm7 family immunity protein n=1 Tax=Streptomyces sp. NPDC102467 TaxID=3366179 RepID=UPI00382E3A51
MYEFHGWFGIAESPEEADTGTLDAGLAELRARVEVARGEVTMRLDPFLSPARPLIED